MEIKELRISITSAPALLVYSSDTIEKAAEKGTILFYHGYTACKEGNRKELYSLAQQGYLAVGIDNVGHGERIYPDFNEKLSRDGFEPFFFTMVKETIEEVPKIIDELCEKYGTNPDKLGICGISMGGYITYGAIITDKRLKVAAPIVGCPRWSYYLEKSPHNHMDKFFPTAILSQTAGKDETVPPEFARELHENLKSYYIEKCDMIKYIEYPSSNHFMVEEDWNILWDNVLKWFKKFLGR